MGVKGWRWRKGVDERNGVREGGEERSGEGIEVEKGRREGEKRVVEGGETEEKQD